MSTRYPDVLFQRDGTPESNYRTMTAGSPAPLRVLLACDHIDHDGALHGGGRQIVELARAFDPSRIDATVCITAPPSQLGRRLVDEGVPLRFLGVRAADPRLAFHFGRMVRRHRIDVMHITDFGASTWGRIAGAVTGTPAVVHVRSHHSVYQPRGFPRRVELAYRALAPVTAAAIAISESVRAFAIERMGFDPRKVQVLNNPLARSYFEPPPPESVSALRQRFGLGERGPIIGTVTRFHAAKGIEYLIDAFAAISGRLPDARLVLVGEGPLESTLRARAADRGVSASVLFAGFQREVQPWLRLFDVMAVPSVEEGFGNVAVEALAMGTPVVASRTGGLPEIVTEGGNGFLVEPRDGTALGERILRIAIDPDLRARMSEEAVADSRRFSIDRYVDQLESIYRDVVNGRATEAAA